MSENKRLTAVVIDTNAFIIANSDFLGVKSALLPSFFSAIKEKELKLLTHPILEKEVEKHIIDSSLYKDYQSLKSNFSKCEKTLKVAGVEDEDIVSKLCSYDIKDALLQAFKDNYLNACALSYSNPEKIFEQYFANKAPFAETGKKKNEFPDAFVLESIKDYVKDHPNDVLLVVTKDNDWKAALDGVGDIEICNSIDEAVARINTIKCILDANMLDTIFKSAYEDMMSEANSAAQDECYELHDFEIIDDLELKNIVVKSVSDIYTPLKITREYVLLKTEVTLEISGEAEVFDEESSIWDSEDREYIYREYADIKFKGEAVAECEVEIAFDFDDLTSSWVRSFKFANKYGIIEIVCETIDSQEIDEDEMALRCLREDKGLPRKHN